MQDSIAKDVGPGRAAPIQEAIYMAGIKPIVNAKCLEITKNGIKIEHEGQIGELEADNAVIAIGSKSNDSSFIEAYAKEHSIPFAVAGDANRPGRAKEAIAQAVDEVLNI